MVVSLPIDASLSRATAPMGASALGRHCTPSILPRPAAIILGICNLLDVAHAARVVTVPGDEVITFAPYFPEYNHYINQTGAVLKVVSADTESFQINFEELEKTINEKTAAILINTPNNPSGIVYSTQTLEKLAALLEKKQEEYGHDIFIISDEPYRDIVFEGVDANSQFLSVFFDRFNIDPAEYAERIQ